MAEYLFWQKHKQPPVTDGQKRQVEIDAGEMNSKARKVRERLARGVAPFGDDGQWLKWFTACRAFSIWACESLQRKEALTCWADELTDAN